MKEALSKALSSSWMIVKLVVPFAIGVDILNYLGIIDHVSFLFEPISDLLNLQAGVALVFAAGFFFNLYAGIAVAASLGLTGFEWTVVGTFLAICHSIPLEVAVLKKVGFPIITHAVSRLAAALGCAALVSVIAPAELHTITNSLAVTNVDSDFLSMIILSIKNSFILTFKIILLVTVLIIVFELLRKWKPIASFLDKHTYMSSLLVGGLLGVTYGAGILLKDMSKVDKKHKIYLLTFLMLAHGLIEETLLFGLFNANLLIILGLRVGVAVIVVLFLYLISSFRLFQNIKFLRITN
ncbi:hypothetical protein [uncultured Aquimarina sp.]|uniref:hypothetical protein n=1 Tax=uncultured Aquimarina sp. TaxID=575652 RepID=UPI00261C9B41|nr:hypothetical protein [uncultured Aquimarina sp.]